ncbi:MULTISPECIES: RDD family protein [unclassified Spirosoma]|uniref:RDD family protein n=1 Tax=unclassified Spirosoma TaxID=2621999 RepID=UPI0009638C7E|nr:MULTISPECIES: RDD family protein [unclassified Spirosoma]MBN8824132.1 RDD family protein [Spirosoma sp.]OJW78873.1 MAG: RDD family protein [Spirosoma sp. 48-14]
MAVAIRTSQNVLLEYEPASIGERILAALMDYLVIFGWLILTVFLPTSLGYQINSFYSLFIALPAVFYDLLSEWLLNGRSIGKLAMRIRVVMLDGSPPGIGAYLIRWLFRIIESGAFLGGIVPVITIAINGKGQRLGDIAAGTTVVRLKPAVTLDDVVIKPFTDNYIVQFPDVRLLSDHDIAIVRNVVRQGDEPLFQRTADKVKAVTGIRSDLGNREFLLTVINDYQFITTQ